MGFNSGFKGLNYVSVPAHAFSLLAFIA